MKIGKYVQQYINQIFDSCDDKQLNSLLDLEYARETFKIGFPFCIEIELLDPHHSKRYWKEIYIADGKQVRVCSQWCERHRSFFDEYLKLKGIVRDSKPLPKELAIVASVSNTRYNEHRIGNAQNSFIRNILGKIGHESFTKNDWDFTKDFFGLQCAYCGAETDLVMDHVIPINKDKMGEHRLGNLVPSCKSCNDKKHSKDFKDFLSDKPEAIAEIEKYMASKNYKPLTNDKSLKIILDMAYKEVADLANRYIAIINERIVTSNDDLQPTVNLNKSQTGLIVYLEPNDEREFKRRLLISKEAEIKITYTDGSKPTVKIWNASRFTESSSVMGNITSRHEFRTADRLANNVKEVYVTVK